MVELARLCHGMTPSVLAVARESPERRWFEEPTDRPPRDPREDRCIRLPLNELGDQRVRLRWHSTSTYLSVDRDGFAVPAAQPFAITVRLRQIEGKGVADTYRLQLDEPTSRFHRHWLSFSSVNQLRTGGWLRAYTDVEAALQRRRGLS